MKNSKVTLADLKESNINQLVDAQMFMIRGGGGCKSKSGKGSKKKSRKKSHKSKKSNQGCGYSYGCGW